MSTQDQDMAILCQNLSRHFGTFVALDQLNLAIPAHSVFGFLGPNGAGKSTTIKLLTGQIAPTQGEAWVAGFKVEGNSVAANRQIGYLSELPQFYGWMRGQEFLEFIGELFGLNQLQRRERALALLKTVGLSEAAHRKISGYSGGMRQRLGIAQAMVNRPTVIFLDEPVSALDPLGRRDVLKLLDELRAETTIFMSSHVLADVDRVCDRVAILNKGSLVAEGPTLELKERYANPNLEIELAGESEPVRQFAETLQAQIWVKTVEQLENGRLKVELRNENDASQAGYEIPRLVANHNLSLLHYNLALPTLEDIFVKLVGTSSTATPENSTPPMLVGLPK
jgi:ABC-2 type transport system ATP-binding protein